MLLVTVNSVSDQDVADRMRYVAQRMHASAPFIEWAVDDAVCAFRETGNMSLAINAGIESLRQVVDARFSKQPAPVSRVAFAWVEGWPSIAAGMAIAIALVVAAANGWLP